MHMSKNVDFWANATLHSKQKFVTTGVVTKEAQISMPCQQM